MWSVGRDHTAPVGLNTGGSQSACRDGTPESKILKYQKLAGRLLTKQVSNRLCSCSLNLVLLVSVVWLHPSCTLSFSLFASLTSLFNLFSCHLPLSFCLISSCLISFHHFICSCSSWPPPSFSHTPPLPLHLFTGLKRGVCSQINHFPDDADYDQDAAEYLLRKSRTQAFAKGRRAQNKHTTPIQGLHGPWRANAPISAKCNAHPTVSVAHTERT